MATHTPKQPSAAPRRRGPKPGTEAARQGALAVRAKYGVEHYQRMGHAGGVATRDKLGLDHYSEIGRRGGASLRATYGSEHFAEMGRKGGRAGRRAHPLADESERINDPTPATRRRRRASGAR